MKMTLEIDTDDVTELTDAQEQIEAALRRHGLAPATDEDAATAIETMWPELGLEARRLLWFAAQRPAEQEFVLEALTQPMGVNIESVRAYHRNLARALKARGIEPQLVISSRKLGPNRFYNLPEPIHGVVTRLGWPTTS